MGGLEGGKYKWSLGAEGRGPRLRPLAGAVPEGPTEDGEELASRALPATLGGFFIQSSSNHVTWVLCPFDG